MPSSKTSVCVEVGEKTWLYVNGRSAPMTTWGSFWILRRHSRAPSLRSRERSGRMRRPTITESLEDGGAAMSSGSAGRLGSVEMKARSSVTH